MSFQLKLVAMVCIFFGTVNAIGAFYSVHPISHSHLNINLGILLFPLGIGLLRLNQLARKLTMIYAWIEIIGSFAFILLFLIPSSINVNFTFMGLPMMKLSPALGIMSCFISVALAYWKYSVLNSQSVRRLFDNSIEGSN